MMLLHGLLLRDSFQCFHLLTDTLVQIRYAHPDLLLDSADHFFLRIRKLKEVLIHGIGTAEVDLNRLLWAEKLLLLDESGTCGDVLDAIQDVLCLGRVRVLSPIKIYASKEEIRTQKSPETVDAPGFVPDASIPVILYGTPDWIRTSGLQRQHTKESFPHTALSEKCFLCSFCLRDYAAQHCQAICTTVSGCTQARSTRPPVKYPKSQYCASAHLCMTAYAALPAQRSFLQFERYEHRPL